MPSWRYSTAVICMVAMTGGVASCGSKSAQAKYADAARQGASFAQFAKGSGLNLSRPDCAHEYSTLRGEGKIGSSESERSAFVDSCAALGVASSEDAVKACEGYVRARLKAPDTAVFPSEASLNVQQKGQTFTVRGYVDAENSFGAQLRDAYVCKVTAAPTGWHLVALTGLG